MIESKIEEILESLKSAELVKSPPGVWDAGHITYLKKCTDSVSIDGLWLEFGVYRGRTICNIAESTSNTIYGFDSFEGLHEHWDVDNPKGVYSLNGEIPIGAIDGENGENPGMHDSSPTTKIKPWPENVKLIKGYFDKTLPSFIEKNNHDIAFINIDSDLYSSAKTVLTLLMKNIKPGTIITFDELIGYPLFKDHEIKAFAEFLLESNYNYKTLFVQNPHNYGQVCFIITK